MPRTPRPNPAGCFHLMNRGSRRWNIFLDDFDRERFLELLAEMTDRFEIEIVAYVLMGNHYHLLVHCPSPNLSEAMHWLSSQYVRGFNKRHGFDGPLFRSRFHSVEVKDDAQLLTTVRYIHRNPLDIDPNIGLASYPWSSHSAYLGWRMAKQARLAALVLCIDTFSMTQKSLIDVFDFPSAGALRTAITRARRRQKADGELESLIERTRAALVL